MIPLASTGSIAPHPTQPFPQFYIIRTDQSVVPLIALDELPSWLQVGNWDWSQASLFCSMVPASLCQIPRVGEYDVICHYCCSSMEIVQKTISRNSETSTFHLHAVDLHRPYESDPGASRSSPSNFFLDQPPFIPEYNPHVLHSEPQFLAGNSSLYAGICLADYQGQGRAPPLQCWTSSPASCTNTLCQPNVPEALVSNPLNWPQVPKTLPAGSVQCQEFKTSIDFCSTQHFSNPNVHFLERSDREDAPIEAVTIDNSPLFSVADSQSAKLSAQIDEITSSMAKLSLVEADSEIDMLSSVAPLDAAKEETPHNAKGKSCATLKSLGYPTNGSAIFKWKKPSRKYWRRRNVLALSEHRNIFSRFKRRLSTRPGEKYNITADKIESDSSIFKHWEVIARPTWNG
jgi:hypothetical protein